MAVTRRGYIFCAFLSSFLSVVLILISIASNRWIVSTANTAASQTEDISIQYGLFRGDYIITTLTTPSESELRMTCVPDVSACAVSCKILASAREEEVRALAQGFRPSTACDGITQVDTSNPMADPPVIAFALYVCLMMVIFLMLAFAVVSAVLAVVNATVNPTEPVFGLPGCLIANVITAVLGLTTLLTFGVYWAVSGLNEHLAFSLISVEGFSHTSSLGYSYWMLVPATLCAVGNIVLFQVRNYLLERDPPPPEIKVENHSDGTIFLY